jgi:hypothetical protein
MEEPKPTAEKPVMKSFTGASSSTVTTTNKMPAILIGIGFILLGVLTGYLLNMKSSGTVGTIVGKQITQDTSAGVQKGQIYGSTDTSQFNDSTDGVLEVNDKKDIEGSHKLVREGGDSKTAYLTSTTLELDKFVGKKVKIWGKTYDSEKAGWFMDVGRIEVLE